MPFARNVLKIAFFALVLMFHKHDLCIILNPGFLSLPLQYIRNVKQFRKLEFGRITSPHGLSFVMIIHICILPKRLDLRMYFSLVFRL